MSKAIKRLRKAGFIIGGLLVIILIMGFAAPKEVTVEREIVIDVPRRVVYKQLNSLKKMYKWMPWIERDQGLQLKYSGTEGTVGAKVSWAGNRAVGSGEEQIVSIEPFHRVETEMRYDEPWEKRTTSYFVLQSLDQRRTTVSWGVVMKNPFPFNIYSLFVNTKDIRGEQLEEGLQRLKIRTETVYMEEQKKSYQVDRVEMPEKSYLARRDTIPMNEMADFYGQHLPEIWQAILSEDIEPGGAPCGLYYRWDEEQGTTDLAAALPVGKGVEIEPYRTINLPAAQALLVNHYGAYDGLGGAHEAIGRYLEDHELEVEYPIVEEYVTDPASEADTSKWLTRVYYRLKAGGNR